MDIAIIAGVDGTADSLAALAAAATLAEEAEGGLVVVHVRHDVWPGASVGVMSGALAGAAWDATESIATAAHRGASDVLAQRRVHWRYDVTIGDPATELIAAARQHKAQAIVVGGRSHGVIGGLAIGSVAQKLVRHSPVSVLVVRNGDPSWPRGVELAAHA